MKAAAPAIQLFCFLFFSSLSNEKKEENKEELTAIGALSAIWKLNLFDFQWRKGGGASQRKRKIKIKIDFDFDFDLTKSEWGPAAEIKKIN